MCFSVTALGWLALWACWCEIVRPRHPSTKFGCSWQHVNSVKSESLHIVCSEGSAGAGRMFTRACLYARCEDCCRARAHTRLYTHVLLLETKSAQREQRGSRFHSGTHLGCWGSGARRAAGLHFVAKIGSTIEDVFIKSCWKLVFLCVYGFDGFHHQKTFKAAESFSFS